jgi:hypothetical protein
MYQKENYTPGIKLETIEAKMSALDPEMRAFLMDIIAEGAMQEPPRHVGKNWDHNLQLTFYYFLSDLTEQELGKLFSPDKPITRQAVNQTVERTVKQLWSHASAEVQQKYDVETFQTRRFPAQAKIQELTEQLLRLQKEGKSPKQIRQELKASQSHLYAVRKKVREQTDSNMPDQEYRASKIQGLWLAKEIRNTAADDIARIQELLNQVDISSLNKYPSEMQLALANFQELIPTHNGNKTFQELVVRLQEAGIPVVVLKATVKNGDQAGIHRYHLLARQHLERAKQVLNQDPKLEKYRTTNLQQVLGPVQEYLPTIYDLQTHPEMYPRIRPLLEECGIPLREVGSSFSFQKFLAQGECPVPIYKYSYLNGTHGYWYSVEQRSQLREYILKLKKELGL